MAKYRVVVTDDRYGRYREEEEVLGEIDAGLEILNLGDEAETIEALRSVDAVLVNLHPLGRRVIESMERCRVISRYGVGYENVDVDAATKAGIWVARVPGYANEDVSDHALALLLDCIRKVSYKDRGIRRGEWNLIAEVHRIRGRSLGLLGYGGIARALHTKVAGLGLAGVLVHDPYVDEELIRQAGAKPVDFETLIRNSDYLSVHVPLNEKTRGLIGERELGWIKEGAILINTSRGAVLEEGALTRALEQGRLGGAGLDVFETEPLPAESPLRKLDNVVLTDHAGYYSEESMVELKTKAARNVAEVLKGGKPIYPVNQPESG